MINSIKQHHKLAVNFAVLGATSFIIATILLFFLWQNITTKKQITELQTTGQRLAKIVDSQAFAEGDAKSFVEFAQLVKSFNQQWDDFKQRQNNIPIEKIKEIDAIKEELNINAPKWLALQKDIVAQTLAKKELYNNTQKMRQMNDEVLNMLLRANVDKQQILTVQQISLNLSQSEIIYKKQIERLGSGAIFHPEDVWRPFTDIDYLLESIEGREKQKNFKNHITEYLVKNIQNQKLIYKNCEKFINLIFERMYQISDFEISIKSKANQLSISLSLLDIKPIRGFYFYLVSIVFFVLIFSFFLKKNKFYGLKPLSNIGFLFLVIMWLWFLYEEKKKTDFYHVTKIEISKNNLNEIIYKVHNNYNNADFIKINTIFNIINNQWFEFINSLPCCKNSIINLSFIFVNFKKNIDFINDNSNKVADFDNKINEIIGSIPYILGDLMLDKESIFDKYPIQQLLILNELDIRLNIISSDIGFAYYSNHKAILDNPIDLTLSDYIATLRKNPNMANADYTIDPEIQNKIKILNTDIESFKQSFRAALAVKKATLAIRDKNLELNAELTRLYNQQITKELMIMTLYSWLCVLFCGYGYVRAIKAEQK